MPVQLVRAERAAQHAVGLAAVHHHRADQRVPAAHLDLRVGLRNAAALRQPVILGPVLAVTLVELGIDDFEILARLDAQAITLDAPLQHRRPADEDRPREALVHHDLHGAQHALVLALGVHDALGFLLRRGEDRLHQQPRVYTNCVNRSLYASKSAMGRVATPESIAALATAGAIITMRRGSKGLGIRYSGPKRRFSMS